MSDNAFCLECSTRNTCKEVCKPLEAYLKKLQAQQGYSDRHRRRKEVVMDAQMIEGIANKRCLILKYGKKWVERQQRKLTL